MIPLWAVETARANFRQSTPAALLSSTNASQATMPEPPGGMGNELIRQPMGGYASCQVYDGW